MRQKTPLLWTSIGCLLALAMVSSIVSAACAPKTGWAQFVSNPPSPDPDYQSVSTITFLCPEAGCHPNIVRDNPTQPLAWTFSNDADSHTRTCTLALQGQPQCGPDGHGYHYGSQVTSTLRADVAPQAGEILWYPCP